MAFQRVTLLQQHIQSDYMMQAPCQACSHRLPTIYDFIIGNHLPTTSY